MRLPFTFIILLINTFVFAQYSWDKGYFINNDGARVECLIKRLDGAYTPKKIDYKLSENDAPSELKPHDIREFGVADEGVFVSATVSIDRSSSNLNQAGNNRNPEWSRETLFLKIIADGQATLYVYRTDGFTRFFYKMGDGEIEQLVYKVYYVNANQVAYNKTYLMQLQDALKCKDIPENITVPYQATPLENLFKKYNKCVGAVSTPEVAEKKVPVIVNLNFRTGINFSKFTATAIVGPGQVFTGNFDSKVTPRIGFELEIYPAFNNRNKRWSILFEPNYRTYSDEYTGDDGLYKVSYSSIEIPLGIRKYFYLPSKNSIFVNLHVVFDAPISNSGGQIPTDFFTGYIVEFDIGKSGVGYSAGIGFATKRFFSEVRYYLNRENAESSAQVSSEFSNTALVLGYRLVK
ncbi:MAG: PorT family protein [Cyclobacteriaceae bacterium]|nr:PorT family protein [Cyclobacteriaceae bacterium]